MLNVDFGQSLKAQDANLFIYANQSKGTKL